MKLIQILSIRSVSINKWLNIFVIILLLIVTFSFASKKEISHKLKGIQTHSVKSDFNYLSSKFLSKRISETKLNDTHVTLKIKSTKKPTREQIGIQSIKKKPEKTGPEEEKINKDIRQAAPPVPANPIVAIEPLFSLLPFGIAPIVYVLFAMIITNLSLASVNRGTITENLNNAETVMDNINAFTGAGREEILKKKKGRPTALQDWDPSEDSLSSENMFEAPGFAQKLGHSSYDQDDEETSWKVLRSKATFTNLVRLLGTALAISYVFEINAGPALVVSALFIGSIILTRLLFKESEYGVHSKVGPQSTKQKPMTKNMYLIMHGPG